MSKFVATVGATLALGATSAFAAENVTVYIPAVVDFQNHTSFNGTACVNVAESCFNSNNAPVIAEMADGESTVCPMLGESFEFIASVFECMVSADDCDTSSNFVQLIDTLSNSVDGVTCLQNGTIYDGCESECRTAVMEFEELSSLFGNSTFSATNNSTSEPTNATVAPTNTTAAPTTLNTTEAPVNETDAPTTIVVTIAPTNETVNATVAPTDYNYTMAPSDYNVTDAPTVSLEELCASLAEECVDANSDAMIVKMNINDNTCDEYLNQLDNYEPLLACYVGPSMAEAGCMGTSFVTSSVENVTMEMLDACAEGFNNTIVETDAPTTEDPATPEPTTAAPTNGTVIIPDLGNGTNSNSSLQLVDGNSTMTNTTNAPINVTDAPVNGTDAPTTTTDAPTTVICVEGCEDKVIAVLNAAKGIETDAPETTGPSTPAPTKESTDATGSASGASLFYSVAGAVVAASIALMM